MLSCTNMQETKHLRLFATLPEDIERIRLISQGAKELRKDIEQLRARVKEKVDDSLMVFRLTERNNADINYDKLGIPLHPTKIFELPEAKINLTVNYETSPKSKLEETLQMAPISSLLINASIEEGKPVTKININRYNVNKNDLYKANALPLKKRKSPVQISLNNVSTESLKETMTACKDPATQSDDNKLTGKDVATQSHDNNFTSKYVPTLSKDKNSSYDQSKGKQIESNERMTKPSRYYKVPPKRKLQNKHLKCIKTKSRVLCVLNDESPSKNDSLSTIRSRTIITSKTVPPQKIEKISKSKQYLSTQHLPSQDIRKGNPFSLNLKSSNIPVTKNDQVTNESSCSKINAQINYHPVNYISMDGNTHEFLQGTSFYPYTVASIQNKNKKARADRCKDPAQVEKKQYLEENQMKVIKLNLDQSANFDIHITRTSKKSNTKLQLPNSCTCMQYDCNNSREEPGEQVTPKCLPLLKCILDSSSSTSENRKLDYAHNTSIETLNSFQEIDSQSFEELGAKQIQSNVKSLISLKKCLKDDPKNIMLQLSICQLLEATAILMNKLEGKNQDENIEFIKNLVNEVATSISNHTVELNMNVKNNSDNQHTCNLDNSRDTQNSKNEFDEHLRPVNDVNEKDVDLNRITDSVLSDPIIPSVNHLKVATEDLKNTDNNMRHNAVNSKKARAHIKYSKIGRSRPKPVIVGYPKNETGINESEQEDVEYLTSSSTDTSTTNSGIMNDDSDYRLSSNDSDPTLNSLMSLDKMESNTHLNNTSNFKQSYNAFSTSNTQFILMPEVLEPHDLTYCKVNTSKRNSTTQWKSTKISYKKIHDDTGRCYSFGFIDTAEQATQQEKNTIAKNG